MILCCRQKNLPLVTAYLNPEKQYRDRKLEVAICKVCGVLLAELTQFNINKCIYEVFRPKRKDTASFIKRMQNLEYKIIEHPNISKSNMSYIYGVNREYKNGKIYQYAVDFNGQKNLVKIIDKLAKEKMEQ